MLFACGTRTQHRMAQGVEDAGFEIRDVICWHYGSGFPKSLDISKAIDKRNGRYFDQSFKDYCNKCRTAKGYSLSVVNELMGTALTGGGFASCTMGDKGDNELPTLENYVRLKEILSMDERFDELIETTSAEREVIGQRKMGFIPDGNKVYGKYSGDTAITAAAREDAKHWAGWGTALKPATEFWTLARKPLSESTIAANVVMHGTGGLNIDACRIGTERPATRNVPGKFKEFKQQDGRKRGDSCEADSETDKGRFPANVILDEFMGEEMDKQSGQLTSGKPCGKRNASNKIYGQYAPGQDVTGYGDTGGASRFFYVAKPSPEERGNTTHPTVKPQTLIQYLIKLICPIEPGRIVLDPFAGSGSHCIAARKLGLDFIAYEIEEHSCNEANERLENELGLFH